METLRKLTWVETKLFLRDPTTLVFTLALPILFLFVMGGVFGNTPDPEGKYYRGMGPTNYYVSAYIGLVIAAIGVVALPVHLTSYRERGVLRRMRASSLSAWGLMGAQVMVSLGITVVGAVLLVIVARFAYGAEFPQNWLLELPALVVGVLSFTAFGVLLGAVLPTTRSAQGLGLILFFVLLILGGAGPPREALTDAMRMVGDGLPSRYAILLLQDPWLGFGWSWPAFGIMSGFGIACALLSVKLFRWE